MILLSLGGGKTTLLNALAMRAPDWCIPSGEIKFNGQMETKETVKATMNYVMAHDKLLPYLTVFETLASAADLKLAHLPKEERRARVECVLTDMCLEKCRDTYIGGEWRQGVSTGKKNNNVTGVGWGGFHILLQVMSLCDSRFAREVFSFYQLC